MILSGIRTYYEEWSGLPRSERKAYVSMIAETYGVHPTSLYRKFARLAREESPGGLRRTDKGKSRKVSEGDKELAAKLIAAAKLETETKTGKVMRTKQIAQALTASGILPAGVTGLSESTLNRWLAEYGWSYRQVLDYKKAARNRMVTDAPTRWVYMDASTSELYYLGRNGIVRDATGILTDKNHREEILTAKGYKKLWIFCAVDLYSHAYYVKGYVTPGESTLVWTRFLFDYMLKKPDPRNPLCGIPYNIYSDKGSALRSPQMQEMFKLLGINHVTHFPGNPKAKGLVESRIGAYKRTIESCLRFERIDTAERYNELTSQLQIQDNIEKGYYQLWMDIAKHPGVLREFTEDMVNKVSFKRYERKVTAYGTVSIDAEEYYVSDRLIGQYVTLYRDIEGGLTAEDRRGNLYHTKGIEHQYRQMTGHAPRRTKTAYDSGLEEIAALGKELRRELTAENHVTGSAANVVALPVPASPVEIQSPVEPVLIQSADDVWYRLLVGYKIYKRTLPQELTESFTTLFRLIIETEGGVAPAKVEEFAMIIKKAALEAANTEAQ